MLTSEEAALRHVAMLVARGAPTPETFEAVAEQVARILGRPGVGVMRYDSNDSFVVLATCGDHPFPVGSRWPLDGPSVEVCAVAKRDLRAGETLDEYGMFMTYGEAVNVDEMSAWRYLPEGLVEGCRLRRDVSQDQVLTYDDVELPQGRLADALRAEQYRHFRGETWLEEHLNQAKFRRAPAAAVQEVMA